MAFLVEETNSPTRERLRGELEKNLPGMRWCVYEPLLSQGTIAATQSAFGAGARVIPKFDRADVVLALDSDFLDCGQGDLASVRAFSSRRRVSTPKDSMNGLPRWYHPMFNWERFVRVSNDGFFLAIESRDPRFTENGVRELLEKTGGEHVTIVHED